VPAPQIAIDYWQLGQDARLSDVIIAVRADEAEHRDVNHSFVDELDRRKAHDPLAVDKPIGEPKGSLKETEPQVT